MLCQNAAKRKKGMENTYDWFITIIDANFVLVANYHTLPAYIFRSNMLFRYQTMNELLPHPPLCWYADSGAGGLRGGEQLVIYQCIMPGDTAIWISSIFQDRAVAHLVPDFCGVVLYDIPSNQVKKMFLLQSGYSLVSRVSIAAFLTYLRRIFRTLQT